MPVLADLLLEATLSRYVKSPDFNGFAIAELVRLGYTEAGLRASASDLVRDGKISCVFASVSINPHIKRLPDLPVETQLDLLTNKPLGEIVGYPSEEVIRGRVDISAYNDRPFTKRLVLGCAQLEFLGFDLTVLDRYLQDPRYHCRLRDYSGMISIGSEALEDGRLPERDQILMENFGLGYTEPRRRILVAFLRYLHQLSPEHQQAWNSYLVQTPVKVLKDYYENAVLGEITYNVSYFTAILAEIKLINQITLSLCGRVLFLRDFSESRPTGLTFFRLPTLRSFNEFALAMDKLFSENLDREFFRPVIPLTSESVRSDGKVVVQQKGTLSLLEDWIRSRFIWDDVEGAVATIVAPLRLVRRLRQNPAHKVEENVYSEEYEDQQHEILTAVYGSVSQLRNTLLGHSSAPEIKIPYFLLEGRILFY